MLKGRFPLLILGVMVVGLLAQIGGLTALKVFVGLLFAALLGLFFVMAKAGSFVGPGVLVDAARKKLRRHGSEVNDDVDAGDA